MEIIQTCRQKEKDMETNKGDSIYWTYKPNKTLRVEFMKYTEIVIEFNDLRDIQLLRYIFMSINCIHSCLSTSC